MEANKLTCEQAKQIDLVDYLNSLGYNPVKTRNNDYWYLSPLRQEKNASFKVNRKLNVWYDHATGRGGTLVDFAMQYFNCGLSETLQKISFFQPQNNFQNTALKPPSQGNEISFTNKKNSSESTIQIIDVKQGLTNIMLRFYIVQRKIAQHIANKYCSEVTFQLNNKIYKAIGFKNSAGGYELRNEYFKGSSSPKDVTYLDNKANIINVFEGFFDFLAYQTIHQKEEQATTNLPDRQSDFLVLNTVSFFEKNLQLMENHERIHLFLDNDDAGKKFTSLALKWSEKFHDESKLYSGYKDLNESIMNNRESINQKHISRR